MTGVPAAKSVPTLLRHSRPALDRITIAPSDAHWTTEPATTLLSTYRATPPITECMRRRPQVLHGVRRRPCAQSAQHQTRSTTTVGQVPHYGSILSRTAAYIGMVPFRVPRIVTKSADVANASHAQEQNTRSVRLGSSRDSSRHPPRGLGSTLHPCPRPLVSDPFGLCSRTVYKPRYT